MKRHQAEAKTVNIYIPSNKVILKKKKKKKTVNEESGCTERVEGEDEDSD